MVIEKGENSYGKLEKSVQKKGGRLLQKIEENGQNKGDDYREVKLQKGNICRATRKLFRQKNGEMATRGNV